MLLVLIRSWSVTLAMAVCLFNEISIIRRERNLETFVAVSLFLITLLFIFLIEVLLNFPNTIFLKLHLINFFVLLLGFPVHSSIASVLRFWCRTLKKFFFLIIGTLTTKNVFTELDSLLERHILRKKIFLYSKSTQIFT